MAVAVTPGTPPVFGKPEPLFEVDLVAHQDRAVTATSRQGRTSNGDSNHGTPARCDREVPARSGAADVEVAPQHAMMSPAADPRLA